MSLIRGVLLAGKFRTQHELNGMSHDDQRNTLIVELSGRTNQTAGHFQSLDDSTLAGTGAVYLFLRNGKIRTEAELKTISDDDQRNILIVELGAQTHLSGSVLQGMNNTDLVILGLGKDNSFIRGVLLAGKFRTQHELNRMSHEDHRNTLIVELSNRTNQSAGHFQSLDDAALAGTGAVLVFLRESGIRDDQALKSISADDQRNILIVELGGQTHLSGSVLQGMSNLELVLEGLGLTPGEDAVAARLMARFYRGTGSAFGPLGTPQNAPHRNAQTGYVQDFQLGSLHLNDINGKVKGETKYEADVTLAAVQCFGTQDNSTDETYVVMSLLTIDPNNPGIPVQTQRTIIQDGVKSGDTIFKNAIRMRQRFSGTSGLMVHLAVWDHESGDQDKLRDDINRVLQDGASKAASALAGGDLAGQGGFVGDIINFEVGGVKPFKVVTLGLAGLLANALADDLIGEHVYVIPPGNIVDLADQDNFTRSIRPTGDALDFDVQFNWPPRPEDEFVFTDGDGTYKVYLRIAGITVNEPVVPNILVHP
jgi:hypothetical protein